MRFIKYILPLILAGCSIPDSACVPTYKNSNECKAYPGKHSISRSECMSLWENNWIKTNEGVTKCEAFHDGEIGLSIGSVIKSVPGFDKTCQGIVVNRMFGGRRSLLGYRVKVNCVGFQDHVTVFDINGKWVLD